MNKQIVDFFINEDLEILDESIILNLLIKKLKSLEISLGSKIDKSDLRYMKISQGFKDLENLIASLS